MTQGQTSQWILHRLHSCLLWWTTTRGLPLCSYVSWKWASICYSVSSLRNCPEFFWAFVLVEREKKINLLLMATTTNSQTDHSLNVFPEELSTILLSFYSGRFFVICYFGPPQPTHKSNIHSAMSSSSNQIFTQCWVPHQIKYSFSDEFLICHQIHSLSSENHQSTPLLKTHCPLVLTGGIRQHVYIIHLDTSNLRHHTMNHFDTHLPVSLNTTQFCTNISADHTCPTWSIIVKTHTMWLFKVHTLLIASVQHSNLQMHAYTYQSNWHL